MKVNEGTANSLKEVLKKEGKDAVRFELIGFS